MRHKGVTLIELMVALSIATLLMVTCCSVYKQNFVGMDGINKQIDARANLRIAMDYLCDRIKGAKSITPGCNSFKIDYDAIYIENDILRVKVDSQQIAYGIVFMEVVNVNGNNLMKVTLKSKTEKVMTFACKRN